MGRFGLFGIICARGNNQSLGQFSQSSPNMNSNNINNINADQFDNCRVECHAYYEGAAEQKNKGAQKGSQCRSFKRSVLIHVFVIVLIHAKVNLP